MDEKTVGLKETNEEEAQNSTGEKSNAVAASDVRADRQQSGNVATCTGELDEDEIDTRSTPSWLDEICALFRDRLTLRDDEEFEERLVEGEVKLEWSHSKSNSCTIGSAEDHVTQKMGKCGDGSVDVAWGVKDEATSQNDFEAHGRYDKKVELKATHRCDKEHVAGIEEMVAKFAEMRLQLGQEQEITHEAGGGIGGTESEPASVNDPETSCSCSEDDSGCDDDDDDESDTDEESSESEEDEETIREEVGNAESGERIPTRNADNSVAVFTENGCKTELSEADTTLGMGAAPHASSTDIPSPNIDAVNTDKLRGRLDWEIERLPRFHNTDCTITICEKGCGDLHETAEFTVPDVHDETKEAGVAHVAANEESSPNVTLNLGPDVAGVRGGLGRAWARFSAAARRVLQRLVPRCCAGTDRD